MYVYVRVKICESADAYLDVASGLEIKKRE